MMTKLTLRMDEALVRRAKAEARRRGKSVSRMVGEFVGALGHEGLPAKLPPRTASLVGVLKGARVSESDYRKHLREKYL
ncbi:MAG: antitoxin [Verrucomicrobiae bacterium]|nr:antitoxin [Verrucomicrobiae bacterium]